MLKTKIIYASLLFGICFLVYFLTAARYEVNIADSNELMTAAFENGVAHPPGYPLYQLVLRIIMHGPPINNTAFAANISSAFLQALGIAVFFLCSLELFKVVKISWPEKNKIITSATAALTLGFSYFYWDQATFAEVFSLHLVLMGLVLLAIFINWNKASLTVWALLGIAFSHHQTVLFLLPGLLWNQKSYMTVKGWIKAFFVFVLFFLIPYLWLYLGVDQQAFLSWKIDPGINGFVELINRGVYAASGSAIETYAPVINLSHSIISVWILLKYAFNHLFLGIAFSLIGLIAFSKNNRQLIRFMLVSLLVSGPLLAAYLKFPLPQSASDQVYFQGTYLRLRMFLTFEYLLSLMIPLGLYTVWKKFQKDKNLITGLMVGVVFIPVYLLIKNYPLVDKHDSNFDSVFYSQVLESLPVNSLLIADSDAVFGLLYQQAVNGNRPDILVIPTAMHMRWGYLKDKLPEDIFKITGYKAMISFLTNWGFSQNRTVMVIDPSPYFLDQMQEYKYQIIPYGYCLQIANIPAPLTAYDYGLSVQVAGLNLPETDLWSRGEKGIFAVRHLLMSKYYGLLQASNAEEIHLKLAQRLSNNDLNFQNYLKLF